MHNAYRRVEPLGGSRLRPRRSQRKTLPPRTLVPSDRADRDLRGQVFGTLKLHGSVQAAIRKMEDDILGVLSVAERRALLTALPKLYATG